MRERTSGDRSRGAGSTRQDEPARSDNRSCGWHAWAENTNVCGRRQCERERVLSLSCERRKSSAARAVLSSSTTRGERSHQKLDSWGACVVLFRLVMLPLRRGARSRVRLWAHSASMPPISQYMSSPWVAKGKAVNVAVVRAERCGDEHSVVDPPAVETSFSAIGKAVCVTDD